MTDRLRQDLINLLETPNNLSTLDNLIEVGCLLHNRKNIILYGGGDGLITFWTFVVDRYGIRPSLILDKKFNPYGEICFGIRAMNPLYYKPQKRELDESVVIITVGKVQYYDEIFKYLIDLGFKDVLIASDIYEYHLPTVIPELREEGVSFYIKRKSEILRCFDILSDELSREIYVKFIKFHAQKQRILIPFQALDEQYFPKEICLKKGYRRYINCGAYRGDTIDNLHKLFGKIEALVLFEPDLDNFQFLIVKIKQDAEKLADQIILFPCAVYNGQTYLGFKSGLKINSSISSDSSTMILAVSIDDVLPNFHPTFISLDVEGAELEAIKGMKHTIAKNKPDIAVCVYHSPNHIWDIPLFIKSLCPDYKLYLRNYTGFPSETVLYATI